MRQHLWLTVALLAGTGWAEVKDIVVDPLATAEKWQVGGVRVNYTLGASSLLPSTEQVREGAAASLKLVCDFTDPQRWYASAYHIGDAIPGRCQELKFWLFGGKQGGSVKLALEDARGRWFERDLGPVDWDGWRELRASVGDGLGWTPLLRHGEERLPVLHPINLRQIALNRSPQSKGLETLYLSYLRATCEVVAADYVTAKLTTGRKANLFDVGEQPRVGIALTNPGKETVTGALRVTATDFFGKSQVVDLGQAELGPGQTVTKEARFDGSRLGPYEVKGEFGDSRVWFARYVIAKPQPERPADPKALFGCCGNFDGFGEADLPLVARLNRDAGIRWARMGMDWGTVNPEPGVWAWESVTHVDGSVGKAIELKGGTLGARHTPDLNCEDAVTIALWARGTKANGAWQAILQKWGSGNRRNYGVYLNITTGEFFFSASYEELPAAGWRDIGAGVSGWDNQWHHYAATYSAAEKKVRLYVDGVLKTDADLDGGNLRTNDDDLLVGSGYPGGLDEVRVYRRALSGEEVKALAEPRRTGVPPVGGGGLIAAWSFEEQGTDFADGSGNGHTLRSQDQSAAGLARKAQEAGLKTLAIIGFPPNWASTAPEGAARPWVYKPKLDAWADYVENLTRQYKDVIQHWEIWNEPNISVFWEPKPDAREFLDVVRMGYEAAKRGNPNCEVLIPGLAGPGEGRWGMDFLEALLKLGAARYCDAISIHPYRQATPEESDLEGDLRHIAELATASGGRKPIWFTENCWTTQLPGGSTEERAARMVPRAYALSLGTGLLEGLIFFRLHDPGVDRFYGEDNYGMCWHDLTPKAAWCAHATFANLLEGAQPDGSLDLGPHALARVFRVSGERIAVIWCPEATDAVAVQVGKPQVRVVEIMGNEDTRQTEGGVLVLQATEDVVYLRDLAADAKGLGAILEAPPVNATRGLQAPISLRMRNPFAEARAATVDVDPLWPGGAQAHVDLQIAGGQVGEATLLSPTPPDAPLGQRAAPLRWTLGNLAGQATLRVGVRSATPDAGPVGVWHFDEGAGQVIKDASGAGNDGTVTTPQWVDGKRGKALRFDGTNLALVPDAPSLNLQDEVTLAFWIKVDADTGTWQFPVGKYESNIRRNYGLYLAPGKLNPCWSSSFEKGSYQHTDLPTQVSLGDGQWHHLAGTYSALDGTLRVYVDGKLAAEQKGSLGLLLTTPQPLAIGQGTTAVIDEVALWPRALTEGEVAAQARANNYND